MKIILTGLGSIGLKHLAALQNIDEISAIDIVTPDPSELDRAESTEKVVDVFSTLADALAMSDAEAIILATPTPLHTEQAITCLEASKHVLVEIPMSESAADAERLLLAQEQSGKTCMIAHTRRFNPPHQWLHEQFKAGTLHLHHLVVETFFHRRENKNALGQTRDWNDSLLWHHACHSVDLFLHQSGSEISKRSALAGPTSEAVGGPLDIQLGLKSKSNALATIALSFNNQGPFGSWFRYICEEGTFKVRYDDIVDGHDKPVEYEWAGPTNGIELQNREFISAIIEARTPLSSVSDCLPAMQELAALAERM